MSSKEKKQDAPKVPVFGGPLADKMKNSIPGRANTLNQNKFSEGVRKVKSTKAFNRKRAGR